MQVEAHGEADVAAVMSLLAVRRDRGEPVLAADVIAGRGDIEPADMGQSMAVAVAVVARLDPGRAVGFVPLHLDRRAARRLRRLRVVGGERPGVGVVERHGRMRRGAAQRVLSSCGPPVRSTDRARGRS